MRLSVVRTRSAQLRRAISDYRARPVERDARPVERARRPRTHEYPWQPYLVPRACVL